MGTHPIFESDFDCLTEYYVSLGLSLYAPKAENQKEMVRRRTASGKVRETVHHLERAGWKSRVDSFFLKKRDRIFNGAEIIAERHNLQIEEQITHSGIDHRPLPGNPLPPPERLEPVRLPGVKTQFKQPQFSAFPKSRPSTSKQKRHVPYPSRTVPLDDTQWSDENVSPLEPTYTTQPSSLYMPTHTSVNIGRSSPSSLNSRLSRIKQRMTQTQRKPSNVKSELERDDDATWSPDGTFFDDMGEFEDLPSTGHSFAIEPSDLGNPRLVDVLTQVRRRVCSSKIYLIENYFRRKSNSLRRKIFIF